MSTLLPRKQTGGFDSSGNDSKREKLDLSGTVEGELLVNLDPFLNETPSIYELCEYVRIGTNWYMFGVLLKLDAKKLDDIKLLNESSEFKALKMFELWLKANPNATRREIIETLKKEAIGENAVAAKYEKHLRTKTTIEPIPTDQNLSRKQIQEFETSGKNSKKEKVDLPDANEELTAFPPITEPIPADLNLFRNRIQEFETLGNDTMKEKLHLFSTAEVLQMQEWTDLILQKYSESLSKLVLPSEIVQTLYTEKVFSNETFDEVSKLGGSLYGGPLRALSNTVSKDFKQLRLFAMVLLQSEDTVGIAKDILKEYDQTQALVLPQSQSDSFTALAIPTSSTLATTNQCITKEFYLSPTYGYTFDQIRVKLGILFSIVIPLIRDVIMLKDLKTFLGMCFRELKPQLDVTESFEGVMELVEKKCTITNICCLETIINNYKIEEAKAHITSYKSQVDEFCKDFRLSIIIKDQNFMTTLSSFLKCETIQFVLEWEPDEYTLQDITHLLWKAFEKMAKRVLVRVVKKGNSIIVTCYAPRNIMDVLLMKAEFNLKDLQKIGLIKLTLGYYIVWDRHTRNKEVRGLMEETKDLEKEVAPLKKASTEKDHQVMELKSLESLNEITKEKPLEIQTLTTHKEATDKELVENKEIETLQRTIRILSLKLREREKDLAQSKQIIQSHLAYFCQVHYEKIFEMEWNVKLIIVRRLEALEKFTERRHPLNVQIHSNYIEVIPLGKSIKFDIDAKKIPRGWHIYQLSGDSEFEYDFIDKFENYALQEPLSFTLKIIAEKDFYMEEVFHFPVTLHGVCTPKQIFIHLSWHTSLRKGIQAVPEIDKVQKASKLVEKILDNLSSSLSSLLSHAAPLQKMTEEMFKAGLVSVNVQNSPSYKDLMSEYKTLLELESDYSRILKYCHLFISILSNQGGPFKLIGKHIATDIREQLDMNFTL